MYSLQNQIPHTQIHIRTLTQTNTDTHTFHIPNYKIQIKITIRS